jgi:glycosyltransferase involved in cell wall biosynthesis
MSLGENMVEPRIVVIIPAWNEAERIGPIIEKAKQFLPVLVVDDGSHDETISVSKRAGANVVAHESNRGKGVALMSGFEYAFQNKYLAAITLDADGQHDPAEIPNFVRAYKDDLGDLIIGRRNFRQMPFIRAFSNSFGSWLLTRILAAPILDNQSGYRLYTKKLVDALDPSAEGFEFEVEVIFQAVVKGLRIGWIPIRTIYGIDKVSYFHPWHDSIKFLSTVWKARQYRRRYERADQP